MLWRLKAIVYDACRDLYPFSKVYRQEVAALRSLCSELELVKARILDIGTGTGTTVKACYPMHKNVTITDKSISMLRRAKCSTGLSRCVVADAATLPFKNGCFDVISAVGVLEYIANSAALMDEMHRIGIPKASVVITYAPRKLANKLRYFLGHPLHLIDDVQFGKLLKNNAFTEKERRFSWLQTQILMTITDF